LGNRLQIHLNGAYFTAFLGNKTGYYPAKSVKQTLAQLNFRTDS